jgi:K(+)-stimulated pyrophosphate-energized sodium pump
MYAEVRDIMKKLRSFFPICKACEMQEPVARTESLLGAVLVGGLTIGHGAPVIYPFLLGGVAILTAILGIAYVNVSKASPTVSPITVTPWFAIISTLRLPMVEAMRSPSASSVAMPPKFMSTAMRL